MINSEFIFSVEFNDHSEAPSTFLGHHVGYNRRFLAAFTTFTSDCWIYIDNFHDDVEKLIVVDVGHFVCIITKQL